jgi:hypothetical protein
MSNKLKTILVCGVLSLGMVSLVTTQAHARKFWGWETDKSQVSKAYQSGRVCFPKTYYVFGIPIKTIEEGECEECCQ